MEQFVLGIFQEHLAKYIIGFRKEQVNANLLNGKGEITNVELNCAILNETLRNVTPYIELESVHVSKLGFHVSSWANVRQAPIIVDIEHVTARIVEPLHFYECTKNAVVRQVTKEKLQQLIGEGLVPKFRNGSYNLLDRILDNLTIEIQSINITFAPAGKFKTRRTGPWTPPAVRIQLFGIRLYSVNELGQEASPAEVWKHNHGRKKGKDGSFLIYKKLESEYQVSIVTKPLNTGARGVSEQPRDTFIGKNGPRFFVDNEDEVVIPLISSKPKASTAISNRTKVESQLAMQRRLRDGEFLALQLDVTIPVVEIDIASSTVPLLAHLVAAATYCMAKDRAFLDPLRSSYATSSPSSPARNPVVTIVNTVPASSSNDSAATASGKGEGVGSSTAVENLALADGLSDDSSSEEEDSGVEDDSEAEEESEISEKEGEDEKVDKVKDEKLKAVLADDNDDTPHMEDVYASLLASTPCGPSTLAQNSTMSEVGRPLLVLPNGIVFHEKVSLSISVHQATVLGTYSETMNGKVQIEAKGVVAELMWPQITKEKGGYIQASVSYLSIKEQHGQRIRPLLIGGAQYDNTGPVEQQAIPLREFGREETFPMFEDRSVRPDPFGLRHTFPGQAFGLKATVTESGDEILVLNEVGIDQFDIVLDSSAWCRMLRFAANLEGGGFDERWHSGDWTDMLTTDMLLHPSMPLHLDECLQPTKTIFLDENEFISSDLLNATIRVTRVGLRVPAALLEDVRSCDIIIKTEETMVTISSALPKTLISVEAADQANKVQFPNDPSDFSYTLDAPRDESNKQCEISTSAKSTFKSRLAVRGLAVELAPVISFGTSNKPRQLLSPAETTVLFCFEGEPPDPESESNLTKMLLIISILSHGFKLNVDFDLLASAASTLSLHCGNFTKTARACSALFTDKESLTQIEESETPEATDDVSGVKIQSSAKGRKILVRRLVRQSRETGGLSLACCFHVAETSLCVWRQNVPRSSPLRSMGRDSDEFSPLVRLVECVMSKINFSIESTFFQQNRRLLTKLSVADMRLRVCDFKALLDDSSAWIKAHEPSGLNDLSGNERSDEAIMVIILSCGSKGIERHAVAFRLEEMFEEIRSWSLAFDLADGIVDCRVDVLEMFALLLVETLLMPATAQNMHNGTLFPHGSVGDFFMAILASSRTIDERGLLQTDESKASVSGEKVDRILRTILSKSIPKSVDIVLLRLGLSEILVQMPLEAVEGLPANGWSAIGIKLLNADFDVSHFASDGLGHASILQSLGRSGETWSALASCQEKGLRHGFKSRQRLFYIDTSDSENSDRSFTSVVDAFDFGYMYGGAKISLSLSDDFAVNDVDNLEDFFVCCFKFTSRCKGFSSKTAGILEIMNGRAANGETIAAKSKQRESPMSIACASSVASIHAVKKWFRSMSEKVRVYDKFSKSSIAEKDKEIANLRLLVFSKEKERLAALAIVSSDAAGWLRYGSAQRNGQRGMMSSTLFPHWAVLRRSLLILYAGPGQNEVVDIITLKDASLREVSGGQRKRDLKRAFAIVEHSGAVHFMVAGNDAEYLSWVSGIHRAVGHKPSILRKSSSLDDADENPVAFDQSSLVSGRAATELSDSRHGVPTFIGDDRGPPVRNSMDAGSGKQPLRNRFAGVAQNTRRGLGSAGKGTKNRFGSVIQAAKQKGKEVAEKRLLRPNAGQDDVSLASTTALSSVATEAGSLGTATEWSCPSCTFANPGTVLKCQMCGCEATVNAAGETAAGHPSTLQNFDQSNEIAVSADLLRTTSEVYLARDGDDTAGSDRDVSGDDRSATSELMERSELEGSGPRLGMKHRLGAAVQRARTARAETQKASFPRLKAWQEKSGPSTNRSMRLRSVSLSDPLRPPRHPFGEGAETNDFAMPLKRLEGLWSVRVVTMPTISKDDNMHDTVSASIMGERTAPSAGVAKASRGTIDDAHETAASGQPVSSAADAEEKLETTFRIEVFLCAPGGKNAVAADVLKKLPDIVSLHTSLSESVARVPCFLHDNESAGRIAGVGMNGNVAQNLGLTALDAVRITGRLLGGLLELPPKLNQDAATQATYAELVSEFLNAMLASALPVDGLVCLVDFLSIADASTSNALTNQDDRVPTHKSIITDQQPTTASEIFNLATLCDSELLRAEKQTIVAQNLAQTHGSSDSVWRENSDTKSTADFAIASPPTAAHQFRDAMHSALMKVMAERDDAHARMVSAGVLHAHEMEQQRKKSENLISQLETLKKAKTTDGATPRSRMELNEAPAPVRERNVAQDMDAELLSLCQQLASEISARTAASLEVVRLKESRKLEQEQEAAEKQAISDELKRLKRSLEVQRRKIDFLRKESGNWKESFEEVVHFREDVPPSDTVRRSQTSQLDEPEAWATR